MKSLTTMLASVVSGEVDVHAGCNAAADVRVHERHRSPRRPAAARAHATVPPLISVHLSLARFLPKLVL